MEKKGQLSEEEAGELFQGYWSGTLTPEQEILFNEFADAVPGRREWIEKNLTSESIMANIKRRMAIDDPKRKRHLKNLFNEAKRKHSNRAKNILVRYFQKHLRAVAAIFILAFAIAAYIILPTHKKTEPAQEIAVAPIIQPGKSGATLTLSDGRMLELTETSSGHLTNDAGIAINNNAGKLEYTEADRSSNTPIAYNTLATGYGQTYPVRLSDNTVVWLNAKSSIRYPVSFEGAAERVVEVTGECYFDVAHTSTSKPFKVKIGTDIVEVLGTAFNIMSYDDEKTKDITLLRGSINVYNVAGRIRLVPGQQANITKSANITLNTRPDLEAVQAWMNGRFIFHRMPVTTALKQLARWYNLTLEYEYQGALLERSINGGLLRNDALNDLLLQLQQTTGLHFKLQGTKLIISQATN